MNVSGVCSGERHGKSTPFQTWRPCKVQQCIQLKQGGIHLGFSLRRTYFQILLGPRIFKSKADLSSFSPDLNLDYWFSGIFPWISWFLGSFETCRVLIMTMSEFKTC